MLRARRHILDREALREGLEDLGLAGPGLVALHSSLGSLGWVRGGAEGVVEAILEALGPGGTLMAPTFTHCFAPRDGAPRDRQGPFDVARVPSTVGRISEALRLHPGAMRSVHPIHSVAAFGPLAPTLTAGHELTSDFGAESPYGRVIAGNGTIVLLGVGQCANSIVHALEDLLDMPYLAREEALLHRPDGVRTVFTCQKCPIGHRDFYSREASKWNDAIQAAGVIRHGKLGRADVQIMQAARFAEVGMALLRATPDLLLCDDAECAFCRWAKERIRQCGLRDVVA